MSKINYINLLFINNIILSIYFKVNPPYFVPLVEIVPSEWTDDWVIKKTRAIMEEIKQSPVTLAKEIPGFALNRIQLSCFFKNKNLIITVCILGTLY